MTLVYIRLIWDKRNLLREIFEENFKFIKHDVGGLFEEMTKYINL